ncbi:hypothetical protein BWQ96_04638 [Gracilariopsis chorda]|uniref:Uncharacterized protein n=1 Tax=Gracilariopsis chorda TaxID=448386 RepID=A0A2V3IU50_9FLOR|nr:hypothetical protein BWQ96_04638 [Gracilariopsis chorda]|eukprot:PXF45633.1 hypothetical protein BWQ96_04638 [Gracilariopsis chorda]
MFDLWHDGSQQSTSEDMNGCFIPLWPSGEKTPLFNAW